MLNNLNGLLKIVAFAVPGFVFLLIVPLIGYAFLSYRVGILVTFIDLAIYFAVALYLFKWAVIHWDTVKSVLISISVVFLLAITIAWVLFTREQERLKQNARRVQERAQQVTCTIDDDCSEVDCRGAGGFWPCESNGSPQCRSNRCRCFVGCI
jgi:hypothetical protein